MGTVKSAELEEDQLTNNNTSVNIKHATQTSNTSSSKPAGTRLTYKKNRSSGSSTKTNSGSSRNQSLTPSNDKMETKHSPNTINPKLLTEKRPSITEAELTPIVVTQLHNTKKHKDELRKARRGSQPKQTDVSAIGQGNGKSKQTNEKNVPDVVSDSGAESCSEETKRKTAEAFMTGIMSSIPRVGTDNDNTNQDGESEDIVSEVENVLTKLMASLQRGDTTVPGLGVSSNNIIPLITNLQASLKANVPRDPEPYLEPSNSASFQEKVGNNNQATDRLSSQVSINTSNVSTVPNQIGASVQTLVPSSLIEENNVDEQEECRNESKIAWKIRAQRKRQQKHLTLGLTREEFANIQESLKHRPLEFGGFRQQAYSLTRNKSDGHILKQRQHEDQLEKIPLIATRDLLQDSPEELGYVSDVCDYNVQQHHYIDNSEKFTQSSVDPQQGSPAADVVHGMLSLSIASDDK